MKKLIIIITVLSFLCISGCQNPRSSSKKIPIVTVSILPLKFFVNEICKGTVKTFVMIPPGGSPAVYNPDLSSIVKLNKSSLYFKIGFLPFEKILLKKIKDVKIKIVDCSKGITLITSKGHDHTGINPHIWLSVKQAKIICKNILDSVSEKFPGNKDFYNKNYKILISKINKLDKYIEKNFIGIKKRDFLVFHPVWSYFAKDYNLIQHSIEINGKKPTPLDIKNTIDYCKKNKIKVILVQSQFDTKSASVIAKEIKGEIIKLNPLSENWIENLKRISLIFKEILN